MTRSDTTTSRGNHTTDTGEPIEERSDEASSTLEGSVERMEDEWMIEVVPVDGNDMSATAEEFLSSARVISDVAAAGSLDVPVFRSPPRAPGLDRSIRRGRRGTTVSVRRRGRPIEAVRSDLIEGVVVANGLDPVEASIFRRGAWSVLGRSGREPVESARPVADLASGPRGVAPVVDLGEHASAA